MFDGKKTITFISSLLFVLLITMILYITIFSRSETTESAFIFELFWSYSKDTEDSHYYFWLNTCNVLLFMPLGFFAPIVFEKLRWWLSFFAGALFSIFIETLQYILKKGFGELDDIVHNSLGFIIGYLVMKGILSITNETNN